MTKPKNLERTKILYKLFVYSKYIHDEKNLNVTVGNRVTKAQSKIKSWFM